MKHPGILMGDDNFAKYYEFSVMFDKAKSFVALTVSSVY